MPAVPAATLYGRLPGSPRLAFFAANFRRWGSVVHYLGASKSTAVIFRFLHPVGGEIIQTFCWPVSLIRVAPMAKLVNQLIAPDCRSLLAFGPMTHHHLHSSPETCHWGWNAGDGEDGF